jgi:hypothetical protein
MFCSNCGNPLNGGVCNICGGDLNSNQESVQTVNQGNVGGTLLVKRPNSFIGIAINIDLTIDGYAYKVANDQQLTFNLTPGVHTITYKVWCRRLKTVQLNVVAGGNYYLEFAVDWLWGGFKLSKNCKLQ